MLYTILPAAIMGAAVSAARVWYMRRPLAHLRPAFPDTAVYKDLKAVYRFKDVAQVGSKVRPC